METFFSIPLPLKIIYIKSKMNTNNLSRPLPLSVIILLLFGMSACKEELTDTDAANNITFISEVKEFTTGTKLSIQSDSDRVDQLKGYQKPLYLHTLHVDQNNSSETAISRAAPITALPDQLGISAYMYQGAWSEDNLPNFMYNESITRKNGVHISSQKHRWPGSTYQLQFFAFYPYNNPNYVISDKTQAGYPNINVTIPEDVAQQQDMLVASSGEISGDRRNRIPLKFSHALSAIKFICGQDMQEGTVVSVALKGIYSNAQYNMGSKTWSNHGRKTNFLQTLNKITSGMSGEKLTTEAQTFMMIPQTLGSDASIEVRFTDNKNITHTLSASLANTHWSTGGVTIYKISSSSINWNYTLTVTDPEDVDYQGGTKSYDVVSYRENKKGIKEPVEWSVQYSTDGGVSWSNEKPDWLTTFTASGSGSIAPSTFSLSVSPQKPTGENPHTKVLRAAAKKGSETAPYNLSNSNGENTVQNTANCYVINAPGYYSLPLVYGNAIQNSKPNTEAYTSALTGDRILKTFINHTGNGITDPYISKNAGCLPHKAELLWQDAPSLITEIEYDNTTDNGGVIKFKVDENNIKQGNAVIAIKDQQNNVLWSWHLWVTDENINKTTEVTNATGDKFQFMRVKIGYCDKETSIRYDARSVKIRFNNQVEIDVNQTGKETIVIGENHPFYQWGRKDPFPPSNGITNANKTWYNQDNVASTASPKVEDLSTGITCVRNYIQKPSIIQNNQRGDNYYHNLWNANYAGQNPKENNVVKTIYDPSPIGFKIPTINAFSGFTTNGGNTGNINEFNGKWDNIRKGWYFYTDATKSNTIFFEASGFRHYRDGNPSKVGAEGYCWSMAPNDNLAFCLDYTSTFIHPYTSPYGRANLFGQNCIRE